MCTLYNVCAVAVQTMPEESIYRRSSFIEWKISLERSVSVRDRIMIEANNLEYIEWKLASTANE